MIYLYIKTHNITGLKYLGMTKYTPGTPSFNKYHGSGVYWLKHLNKHGHDITTDIIYYTPSLDDFKQVGKWFSNKWDIVNSTKWANLTPESGDGAPSGTFTAKDINGNTMRVNIHDPRVLNGELTHHTTGMMTVIDSNGNTSFVSKDDHRVKNGELTHIRKGKAVLKDTAGNSHIVNAGDPRLKTGELVSAHRGWKPHQEHLNHLKAIGHKPGKNNKGWKGYVGIIDVIEFEVTEQLAHHLQISPSLMNNILLNTEKIITKKVYAKSPYLQSLSESIIGKPWESIGIYRSLTSQYA